METTFRISVSSSGVTAKTLLLERKKVCSERSKVRERISEEKPNCKEVIVKFGFTYLRAASVRVCGQRCLQFKDMHGPLAYKSCTFRFSLNQPPTFESVPAMFLSSSYYMCPLDLFVMCIQEVADVFAHRHASIAKKSN